jgi:hypothetical protein
LKDSPKRIQENLTRSIGESTAPFGKNEKGQSANEKIFELTMVSPAYFFIHILPLLVLSKVGYVRWGGDIIDSNAKI